MKTANIGYPRIGAHREWKKALEAFWKNETTEETLKDALKNIRIENLEKQQKKNLDFIPVADSSWYDHILDTAWSLNIIPERFRSLEDTPGLDTYFAIARGTKDGVASEMTKWFNTNYHYIVPEFDDKTKPALVHNRWSDAFNEAKEIGIDGGVPVIVGPYTFLSLSKGVEQFSERLNELKAIYINIFKQLEKDGAAWVQVDEPILSTSLTTEEVQTIAELYNDIKAELPQLNLKLQTYFSNIAHWEIIKKSNVDGFGLDFVHDGETQLKTLTESGFPEGKTLFAGVLNGRNIWRSDIQTVGVLVKALNALTPDIVIQPSCSLLHVPVTVELEKDLPSWLRDGLAFADEKLTELSIVSDWAAGKTTGADLQLKALATLQEAPGRQKNEVRQAVAALTDEDFHRASPYAERKEKQKEAFQLPLLPTTTIGSLPQTQTVRQERLKWRRKEKSNEEYEAFIQAETKRWVDIQEELDIDVLVHGEFERTDMVEYFGEKLDGFAFTRYGWVQSYGSRCVKPPVIYGDVAFREPMTVAESKYAQSLTSRPVKGMLTGPITILNWSFVRNDVSRRDVVLQIGLALREEIRHLEENGITMIQVDEPALREGLPLKKNLHEAYLNDAVESFRLATSAVKPTTQIHTHMCYSEFDKIIKSIDALDADVISIETSRSHGELVSAFEDDHYDKGIGLGVYDIHSPRVPTQEEMVQNIKRALTVLDPEQFWVNPDCGLKTRAEKETVEALKVMVKAAHDVRESVLSKQQ
ncbi:5-methyltetrahydropteroyltriglutamate--homocysteine S-methyltransferase [Bacillaceae bacterium SIJ1]|uniref:5-methyltetrahydropteroyltriglutamate-- homocysteine S-methyltransferase n=1 Tax=Litoribacterium kuwaitense TaxID=1398745 RepID=UPI0013EC07E1|nr:5-methyltetrahydropteroyltriglutamate--homocysteine S-methyltransferase [Litoribacterium kuwaitense]NGP44287.1 5-methyltetrahydropteroyltriglutamate--homocysteine S-methyltransferase [Litoribacterium kuwaitense]